MLPPPTMTILEPSSLAVVAQAGLGLMACDYNSATASTQ
jgi:hypothetical protein